MTYEDKMEAVARAEDTYDLLSHIAWTDSIKPKLDEQLKRYSDWLVSEALGAPLPVGLTREQIAGMAYGIKFISGVFEKILKDGEKALKDLNQVGLRLQ